MASDNFYSSSTFLIVHAIGLLEAVWLVIVIHVITEELKFGKELADTSMLTSTVIQKYVFYLSGIVAEYKIRI